MPIYQAPSRVGAPATNGWVSVARACRSRARRASFPNTMFLLLSRRHDRVATGWDVWSAATRHI